MSVFIIILKVLGLIVLFAIGSYIFGKFAAAGFLRTMRRNVQKPNEEKTHEQKK